MKIFGIFGLFALILVSQCQAHPFRRTQKSFPSDEIQISARNHCGTDQDCIYDFIEENW